MFGADAKSSPEPSRILASSPSKSSRHVGAGFLGQTSISSIFPDEATLPWDLWCKRGDVGLDRIREGAQLLALAKDERLLRSLMDQLPEKGPGIIQRSAVSSAMERLHRVDMPPHLTELDYILLSDRIFRDTSSNPSATLQEEHERLSIPHLRWEFFGLLFSFAALSLATISKDVQLSSPAGLSPKAKGRLLQELVDASSKCVEFNMSLGTNGELAVWLLYQNLLLLFTLYGANSKHYRIHCK